MTPKIYSIVNDSSKADEIDALGRLVEQFRQGSTCNSYLATLFTDEFFEWCKGRILSDFTIDVMDGIKGYEKDLERVQKERNDYKSENLELVRSIETQATRHAEQISAKDTRIEGLCSELKAWQASFHATAEERATTLGELREAQETIELQDKAIRDLKVKLFDLMNPQ